MRVMIPELLWIGHALDARNIQHVMQLEIRAVVDLAAAEPSIQFPRDIIYCRFPLDDGPGNSEAALRAAVSTTAIFLEAKVPTLVSCSAGMSRSPAIVAAAIAAAQDTDPDTVLAKIAATGPHDVCPGLWSDIKRAVFCCKPIRGAADARVAVVVF